MGVSIIIFCVCLTDFSETSTECPIGFPDGVFLVTPFPPDAAFKGRVLPHFENPPVKLWVVWKGPPGPEKIDCSSWGDVAANGIFGGSVLAKFGCRFYLRPLL